MTDTKTHTVITKDLRATLKSMLAKEINNLPDYLENLPSKDRLDYLLKLMPYVFPKMESVRHDNGEPGEFSFE